jgi:hypothetical protein
MVDKTETTSGGGAERANKTRLRDTRTRNRPGEGDGLNRHV